MFGQLYGEVPYRAGTAGHEQPGAGQRFGMTAQADGGGEGGDAQTGPELVGGTVGQRYGARRRHHAVLGRRPVAVGVGSLVNPHALA